MKSFLLAPARGRKKEEQKSMHKDKSLKQRKWYQYIDI